MAALKTYSWIDSEERVLSVISEAEDLHSTGLHTDCVLVGGGVGIGCHTVMLASVSNVFRDVLPQPGEEREDTVIILPDWDEEELRLAVTMLYCGALCYKAGDRERVGRVAALLESIGVKGFSEEVVRLEQEDAEEHMETNQCGANNGELKILDIRTVTTEELKVQSPNGQTLMYDKLAEFDQTEHSKINPDVHSSKTISKPSENIDASNMNTPLQCFRCEGHQSSFSEYMSHLLEHQVDTRKCCSKLLKKVKEGDKYTDWYCESCYIDLLTEKQKNELGQEALNILNSHQKACVEEVEQEIETIKKRLKLTDSPSKNDNSGAEEDIPTCDQCGKKFKLRMQLNKHKKSCTSLIQEPKYSSDTPSSLLGLLTARNWTVCPCCLEVRGSDVMVMHLVTHQEIEKLLDEDTPEHAEYRCSDSRCCLSWTPELRKSFIMHKYQNCKHTAKSSLEELLDRFTLGDIKVMEEKSMSDKKTSDDGMVEVCINEKIGNPNSNVLVGGCSENVAGREMSSNRVRYRSGSFTSGEEDFSSSGCRKKKRDASCENTPISLKCPQCLRVFRDTREYKSQNKHFCMMVEKLSEPLREEINPTASKLVTHKCTICVGGPVLASDLQFKKHLSLAHKGIFFVIQLKEKGLNTGVGPCYICRKELEGWEDAVTHVGIDHEKLFQALKHDKNNDYKVLMKRLFPEKYSKWFSKQPRKQDVKKDDILDGLENSHLETSMDTGISTMDVNSSMDTQADISPPKISAKRKLVPTQNQELEVNVKKSRNSASDSPGASASETSSPAPPKSPRTSCQCKNCLLPDCRQCMACLDRVAYGGEGKLKKRCDKRVCLKVKGTKSCAPKERLPCTICPSHTTASYSNLKFLHQHMADAHFSEYILTHYPHPISGTSFPCQFPNCSKTLASGSARVKHLGVFHKQVDLCLAFPKLREQAKETVRLNSVSKNQRRKSGPCRPRSVSLDADNMTCSRCNTNFATKEGFKLHTCHSLMDKSEKECMEKFNPFKRTPRLSNLTEFETLKANSVKKIPESKSDSVKELPSTNPALISSDVYDFVPSPVMSATPTPTKLQLMLSDSEEEDSIKMRKKVDNFANLRKKVEGVNDSDSDDSNKENGAIDMFDNHEPGDIHTPPGFVLEKTVTAVTPYLCNACNKKFENKTAFEMHRICENCSSQNRSLSMDIITCENHTTCEYCCKCFNKGVDVHVTCDAAKCKKCFSSEQEKTKHFNDKHGWDDL